MSNKTTLPVALTIAGSDSGGGAGIQADLKTFAALGVHGTTAITCLTAQNPERVSAIEPCKPRMVRQQIETVFEELPPAAAKTGMLYSAAIIRVVAGFFRVQRQIPLVVDPVMISTSGRMLLKPDAFRALIRDLLPLAIVVTPNLDEAARLTGKKLRNVEDMREAARIIKDQFGCAVVVKGGHLGGGREAVDIFYDGKTELLLSAPYRKGLRTHGTGCTFSAAIAAALALGLPLHEAVRLAKDYITNAIANRHQVRGHIVLNHNPK